MSRECERVLGFSIPRGRRILQVCYDGIVTVQLGPPVTVRTDRTHPEGLGGFDPERQVLQYDEQTYSILGVLGGRPILRSVYGEQLALDRRSETVVVRDKDGRETLMYQLEDLAGNWAWATFSEESDLVAVGEPYELLVFERV